MTPEDFKRRAKAAGWVQSQDYVHLYENGVRCMHDTELMALFEEMDTAAQSKIEEPVI